MNTMWVLGEGLMCISLSEGAGKGWMGKGELEKRVKIKQKKAEKRGASQVLYPS